MNERNDSLLEIAVNLMKRKKKPQTLKSMLNEIFERKGIEQTEQAVAQFEVDFMLSGLFIYCGEDKDKNQLWDLKERQPSSLLDKDGGVLDLYEDDEEATKNELRDDVDFADKNVDDYINDDEIDKKDDEDDIEEELGLVGEDEETSEIDSDDMNRSYGDDEDEYEDIDEEDEEDDIEEALRKQRK